jgi:hypothetical protein
MHKASEISGVGGGRLWLADPKSLSPTRSEPIGEFQFVQIFSLADYFRISHAAFGPWRLARKLMVRYLCG